VVSRGSWGGSSTGLVGDSGVGLGVGSASLGFVGCGWIWDGFSGGSKGWLVMVSLSFWSTHEASSGLMAGRYSGNWLMASSSLGCVSGCCWVASGDGVGFWVVCLAVFGVLWLVFGSVSLGSFFFYFFFKKNMIFVFVFDKEEDVFLGFVWFSMEGEGRFWWYVFCGFLCGGLVFGEELVVFLGFAWFSMEGERCFCGCGFCGFLCNGFFFGEELVIFLGFAWFSMEGDP